MAQLLFSFGTLRDPRVQMSLYGRQVASRHDRIQGYRVGTVRITDPAAIAASGSDVHPALVKTGEPADVVAGEVLELTDDELAATHRYEQVSFMPIDIVTESGRKALAYAPKPDLSVQT